MSHSDKDHPKLAEQFNADEPRVDWHDETLWWVRVKRDKAARSIPEWEQLRETASRIKNNVLANLSEYLIQFENRLPRRDNRTWAKGWKGHNAIVLGLLQHGIDRMVAQIMLTENVISMITSSSMALK